VLEAIYDLTDGQTLGELVDPGRLQEIVEIEDRAELDSTIHWLSDRGYAGYVSFGGIGIQPAGVDRIEETRRTAATAVEALAVVPVGLLRDIEVFVRQLSLALERGELPLDREQRAEVEADHAAIEAQAKSPKPKRKVMLAVFGALAAALGDMKAGVLVFRGSTHAPRRCWACGSDTAASASALVS